MEGRGFRGCPPGPRSRRRRLARSLLLPFALLVVLSPAVAESHGGGQWERDLQHLESPYDMATGVTAMVLSPDGHTLVVGSDTGGVVFFNTTTGNVVDAAETGAHGAVRDIRLDGSGRVAAIVYTDGYVAVISTASRTPILTFHSEGGAPAEERPFIAAVPSHDGRYLVVTGDTVRLFHRGSAPEASFQEVGIDETRGGPFVWFHRELLVLGVLSPDGIVSIYSYSSRDLTPRGQRDITDTAEQITGLAVSGDGSRFAVAQDGGTVTRYTPSLNPSAPQLIPDFKGSVGAPPLGLALDGDGQRLAAWSGRELLWVDGCNQNIALCDGKTTEKDTVRLRPPGFGTRIGTAAVTPDLSRAVLQIEGESRERRLYNLPGLDHFILQSDTTAAGHSALAPGGTTIFLADGTSLRARAVTPAELPLPEVTVERGPGTGGPEDDDGFGLLGVPTEVLLYGGIGVLALLLLVVIVSVVLAAGRTRHQRPEPLPSLAPAPDEALSARPPPSMGGAGAVPGTLRAVAPSAPPSAPPPEGLLVLQQAGTPSGQVPLTGLDLNLTRAEVVRVAGEAASLRSLADLLAGHAPFHGTLAVGGASARETPVLFRRRVRVGLGAPPTGEEDAASLFRRSADSMGLPVGLVERRMQKDLGWMGERLHRPVATLRPLDRWKVRLALVLVDRPHLVVLEAQELPWEAQGEERVETLRRVLNGVARQYDCLVLLLDEGTVGAEKVRRLADEEVVLGPAGFRDRRLLEEGRPVGPPAAERARPRGRRRRPS